MGQVVNYPSKQMLKQQRMRVEMKKDNVRFRVRDKVVLDKLLMDEVLAPKDYEVLHDFINEIERCEHGMYRTSKVNERVDGGSMDYENTYSNRRLSVENTLHDVADIGSAESSILLKIINDKELSGTEVELVRENFFQVVDAISKNQVAGQ